MKLHINKIILSSIVSVLSVMSCSYDDTPLSKRIDKVEAELVELRSIVDNLNLNINSLVVTLDAVKNSDQITSISELPDKSGYLIEFSKSGKIYLYHGSNGIDGVDGKDGNDGENGSTPIISVKLDIDGNYYWTVNGEYLTDDSGNKIAATAHVTTPQLRINDGNFEISYNGGSTWNVIGPAGTAAGTIVFKSVLDNEDSVTFVLSDDSTIVVPKAQQFVINVESTDIVASAGGTAFVTYAISAADENTVVDAFGTKGFEVELGPQNYNADFSRMTGSLNVTVPETLSGKVYLIAVNSKGTTAARILSFEEGQFTIDESAFTRVVPAEGGTIEVAIATNMQYTAMVDPSCQWMQVLDTRAVRNETLTINVLENTSVEQRESYVMILNDQIGIKRYTVIQKGASDLPPQPVGGGEADLETFNNGEKASTAATYTSQNNWTCNLSTIVNTDSEPYTSRYNFTGVRPELRGMKNKKGELISPVLSGGIGTLTFEYGLIKSLTGALFNISILDASGNTLDTKTYTNDTITGDGTIDKVSIDFNIPGEFKIVLRNEAYNNSISKQDNTVILSLSWTGYSE